METKVACDHSVLVGVADWKCVTEAEYQVMRQNQQIGLSDVFLLVLFVSFVMCVLAVLFRGGRGKM